MLEEVGLRTRKRVVVPVPARRGAGSSPTTRRSCWPTDHERASERADSSTVAELTESLRLARRETEAGPGQQEAAVETLQRVRRQRAAARAQVRSLARPWPGAALGALLGGPRRGLAGRGCRAATTPPRGAGGREIEATDLFDAGWYLRQHPDVVEDLVSPAVHYVRTGARRGAEPGPGFDSAKLRRGAPDARDSGLPPLVHLCAARTAERRDHGGHRGVLARWRPSCAAGTPTPTRDGAPRWSTDVLAPASTQGLAVCGTDRATTRRTRSWTRPTG